MLTGQESGAEKSHVSDEGDKSSASPNVETRNEKVSFEYKHL